MQNLYEKTRWHSKVSLQEYLAEDGLMSLNPNAFKPPYKEHFPQTSNGDNGILVRAEFEWLIQDVINRTDFIRAVMRTQHESVPGLFHRNPGRDNYVQSHDNWIGQSAGLILFDDTVIMETAMKHWPIWNNVDPGKVSLKSRHTPSGVFQGHVLFLMYLAAGKTPHWVYTVWHILNLIYSRLGYKEWDHNSEHLLCWLRIKAIDKRMDLVGKRLRPFVKWSHDMYKRWRIKHGGITHTFNRYYGGDHPCSVVASGKDW